MPEFNLHEVSRIIHANIVGSCPDITFKDYFFDSRQMNPGSLFFALKSETGDGHDYVSRLAGIPGVAAVVERGFPEGDLGIPLLRVESPMAAAVQLALHVRENLRGCTFVAITGSAGKTTTKEFVYQILAKKYCAYRSPMNWNNQLGLPFSLLKMRGDEDAAVFEMGMSTPGIGEIDALVKILRPDFSMILNIFPVHLEFLKTMENVAKGKCEVLNHLRADGVGFINGDFDLLRRESMNHPGERTCFGRNENNDIVLHKIERKGDFRELWIDFYGIRHVFSTKLANGTHLENLFASIVLCRRLGMKIWEIETALKEIEPVQGRGIQKRIGDYLVVDETYNSNPEALKKTLSWVDSEYKEGKVAVLGDMLELGEEEALYHTQVGGFFASLSFRMLVTVGDRAMWIAEGAKASGFPESGIRSFRSAREAGEFIRESIPSGSVILFKASRGIRLENAIEVIGNG